MSSLRSSRVPRAGASGPCVAQAGALCLVPLFFFSAFSQRLPAQSPSVVSMITGMLTSTERRFLQVEHVLTYVRRDLLKALCTQSNEHHLSRSLEQLLGNRTIFVSWGCQNGGKAFRVFVKHTCGRRIIMFSDH